MCSDDVRKKKSRKSIDRLSNLLDSLLHHIFSFLDTIQAVKTCVLSKRWRDFWVALPHLNFDYRWRDFWVALPHLNFDYRSFKREKDFQKFVRKVSSSCHENPNFGGKFRFRKPYWTVDETLIKKVISCIVSYRFQHLHIKACINFPDALLSSKSIEMLDLNLFKSLPRSFASFEMLNSLHLKIFHFASIDQTDELLDPFVNCPNLKNLSITNCSFVGLKSFRIPGMQLLSLSLEDGWGRKFCLDLKIEIFAPNVTSFRYKCNCLEPMVFGEVNLPSLKYVDVPVSSIF
ncbi:hypothetical protein GH714_034534 [Hevea brasiliensis]|uniref:Uncharacterized protein n=1 Tax=Hevea brasiliensis TaxID=3981 RepID=A0A6A6N994_HEVBR|nr:hypothetical protein GH714_034534 [Hevea brasiliensis]